MKTLLASLAFLMPLTLLGGADHFDFKHYQKKPADWFRSAEGSNIVTNVLSHQSNQGGWPKNIDTAAAPSKESPELIKGTFDNGATTGEIRFLAKAFNATDDARCRQAMQRGLEYILKAQYPTGGWPQFYPPDHAYHRYITFNDNAMVHLLELLQEIGSKPDYAFIDPTLRNAAHQAFDRGIECIIKCQIRVNGRLTVWCAQHDEKTLAPREGRKFEPISLSGAESGDILILLMSLKEPSADVQRAVHAGATWFDAAKQTGLKQIVVDGDKKIVKDETASPLWARFYEIATNRPIFSDRDSVIKYDLSEIGHERRNGYAWYGNWGEKVTKRYAEWKQTHPADGK